MMELSLTENKVFVWNADDWLELREKHRIVGNMIGCLSSLPRQDTVPGLPQQLLPEEVNFLLENKIAKLIAYKDLNNSKDSLEKYNKYKQAIHKEQAAFYEHERKKQVSSMIDRIIAGKKRKLSCLKSKKDGDSQSNDPEVDREVILKNELEKCSNAPLVHTLVQTFTADVWNRDQIENDTSWNFPSSEQEKLKYEVYKDLRKKEYFISSGQKFGGDFLVYPGDPVKFHAQFIVICQDIKLGMTALDLISLGRIGSSTRKTVVIASFDQHSASVVYQSINWVENSSILWK